MKKGLMINFIKPFLLLLFFQERNFHNLVISRNEKSSQVTLQRNSIKYANLCRSDNEDFSFLEMTNWIN